MERIDTINPQRLTWCMADLGVGVADVAAETGLGPDKLQALLDGSGYLTFPQLRTLADFFGRSLFFFLESGPADAALIHSPQFRTLAGQKPDLSRRVRQLVERVERQRALYLDLLAELEGAQHPPFEPPKLPSDPVAAARVARDWLELGEANTFDQFRAAVENKGVLVFRTNGYAGRWQIAKESPILGFALYDPAVPVIVVKKQDAEARQSFTLMHELGHLLLHRMSSVDDEADMRSTKGMERDANQFAAHLLVPESFLALLVDAERPEDLASLDEWMRPGRLASGASAEVLLLRLVGAGRLSQAVFDAYREWRAQLPPPTGGLGSRAYRHREPKHVFGDRFVRTVLSALNARQISLSKASDYLDGLKVSDLRKLEGFYVGA